MTARENLSDRGTARLEAALQAGDPGLELTVAWHVYQDLRSMFHAATPAAGRSGALKVLDSFHTCPVSEIARLGRTLRSWWGEILAYFDTGGISNGGTEAINHHCEGPSLIPRVPQLRELPGPDPAGR